MDNTMSIITPREPTPEELAEWQQGIDELPIIERKAVEDQRRSAYQLTADPLFFGYQRGDNTEQEWLDAVQLVKDTYPYPEASA